MGDKAEQSDDEQGHGAEQGGKHEQKDLTKSTTNGGPVGKMPDDDPGGKHDKK